ncbi:radical SAM protein [Humidesulfovibrio sp.]
MFCDQAAQTGQAPEPLDALYQRLEALLSQPPAADAGPATNSSASPGESPDHRHNAAPGETLDASLGDSPAQRSAESPQPAQELAFYGGTFTALPRPWPRRFMELAGRFLASGRLTRIRCSTRPDAVDPARLAELKDLGLSLVELGVQSFDDAALWASQRGYDGQTARRACRAVGEAGLSLGIQLMPGLPGHTPAAFQADVAQAAAFAPELARLYPCLVLAGTPLAESWRTGAYAPWSLDTTVEQLALALPVLWAAGVPTARMGLAEQQGLTVLAGPRHPALGQMARSVALLALVRQRSAELAQADGPPEIPTILALPRRLQGEALGHKNALAPHYAALGLALHLWDEPDLALCAR